jgi:hypothetical protein
MLPEADYLGYLKSGLMSRPRGFSGVANKRRRFIRMKLDNILSQQYYFAEIYLKINADRIPIRILDSIKKLLRFKQQIVPSVSLII